jgi:hypothetical protein
MGAAKKPIPFGAEVAEEPSSVLGCGQRKTPSASAKSKPLKVAETNNMSLRDEFLHGFRLILEEISPARLSPSLGYLNRSRPWKYPLPLLRHK